MASSNKFLKICQKCKAGCCNLCGPDFSESEMKRVLKAGFPDYFIKVGKNHYEVKSKKGRCPYLLKDNACKIEKVKPLMCLSWPVVPVYESGKRKIYFVECPLTPTLSKKETDKCMKQARKLPEEIIKGNTTLPDSEISLMQKRYKRFKKKRVR